jgi:hypothetical protein
MPVHAFGVGGFGVLTEVDAGGLVFWAEPKADHPIDQLCENERNRERIKRDDHDRQRLLAQLGEAAP